MCCHFEEFQLTNKHGHQLCHLTLIGGRAKLSGASSEFDFLPGHRQFPVWEPRPGPDVPVLPRRGLHRGLRPFRVKGWDPGPRVRLPLRRQLHQTSRAYLSGAANDANFTH